MKPATDYFLWNVTDLTQGHIHRKDDGSIIIRFPKKWEVRETLSSQAPNGDPKAIKVYNVLEWDEVPFK